MLESTVFFTKKNKTTVHIPRVGLSYRLQTSAHQASGSFKRISNIIVKYITSRSRMVGMLVCVVTFRNYSATSRLPDLLLPWQNNTKEFHVFVVNIHWQSHFKYITNSSTIPRLYIIRKDGNAKFPINGISKNFFLEKLSLSILDIYWINIFTNSLKDWLISRTIYINKKCKVQRNFYGYDIKNKFPVFTTFSA